jgi:hypothetical protein
MLEVAAAVAKSPKRLMQRQMEITQSRNLKLSQQRITQLMAMEIAIKLMMHPAHLPCPLA